MSIEPFTLTLPALESALQWQTLQASIVNQLPQEATLLQWAIVQVLPQTKQVVVEGCLLR